jgi:serine/threonine protein kinase
MVIEMFTPGDLASDAHGTTVDLQLGAGVRPSANTDIVDVIAVGRVLRDRYVIQGRLGAGGKGTVYRALDLYRSSLPSTEQHVALKVLHSGRDCSDETITELRRELHCGQVLSHRNIVNVFELDRDAEIVFFTMELLVGELLSDIIDRVRPAGMQRFQAWQLTRQLGAGLAHAHERGVIHGDLKPRNIFVNNDGELRILDFGASQKIVRARGGRSDRGQRSGTLAYASCEMLEGRATEPSDDLYALACICYEMLHGAHPFARRPANVARDYGVRAMRPAGLTGLQWSTLQKGLSWHRAGRSMGVNAWIHRLTHRIAEQPSAIPLRDIKAASAPSPLLHSRPAAACIAVALVAGICIAQLRETSAQKMPGFAASRATGASATAAPVNAQVGSEAGPPTADSQPTLDLITNSRPPDAMDSTSAMVQFTPPARQSPLTIAVDGYHVSSGDHFVEIRVHRNQLQKNASFAWWTEPATAIPDVDYVPQAKAIQSLPSERRSTRFYVKLLPESGRSQPNYFYVAIAQPGHGRSSNKVTRLQVWLPTPRDQLQASR